MKKIGATIPLLLLSAPVYAHDFSGVFSILGATIFSLVISIAILGKRNISAGGRVIFYTWVLFIVSVLVSDNMLVLVFGAIALLILQPIFAVSYRIYNREKKTL